jgi:hypothetical protein
MLKMLKQIFPTQTVFANYSHPDLHFANLRRAQLDVYFPDLMLGLEYQGEAHYGHSSFKREDTTSLMKRDAEKKLQAAKLGITLVEVPYWWDGSKLQLEATIQQHRPDLIDKAQVEPISLTIPAPYKKPRRIFKNNYTAVPSKGRCQCRGCGTTIPHDELCIAATAKHPKLSEPFMVHVSYCDERMLIYQDMLEDGLFTSCSTKEDAHQDVAI